jgi:hypothetical protein
MATILYAWELGGGLAHLMQLRPLARGLCRRGHRVVAMLRDLSRTRVALGDLDLRFMQAPIQARLGGVGRALPRTFADVLWNIGFADPDALLALTLAWREAFSCVRPDLILFDHSPTALLAARGLPVVKALVGNGFCCPPDVSPLPDLRPWLQDAPKESRHAEHCTLQSANRVLEALGEPPLARLSQLYGEVDESILATFPELDPYRARQAGQYVGAWASHGGAAPQWPAGPGQRVFAYLKPFPAVSVLLAQLNRLKCPTLVSSDGLDAQVVARYSSATLHFTHRLLDLEAVGRECDLAILNGNHGLTAAMLQAGRPMLQLPIYLEQAHNALGAQRMGTAESAGIDRPQEIRHGLGLLLESDRYRTTAEGVAGQYSRFSATEQIGRVLDRLSHLLN